MEDIERRNLSHDSPSSPKRRSAASQHRRLRSRRASRPNAGGHTPGSAAREAVTAVHAAWTRRGERFFCARAAPSLSSASPPRAREEKRKIMATVGTELVSRVGSQRSSFNGAQLRPADASRVVRSTRTRSRHIARAVIADASSSVRWPGCRFAFHCSLASGSLALRRAPRPPSAEASAGLLAAEARDVPGADLRRPLESSLLRSLCSARRNRCRRRLHSGRGCLWCVVESAHALHRTAS